MAAQVLRRQGWNRSAIAGVMGLTLLLALLSPGMQARSGELVAAARESLTSSGAQESAVRSAHAQARMESLPLNFIPNVGQTDPQAAFVLQDSGTTIWFTPQGLTFSVPQSSSTERWVLKLDFVGAAAVTPVATGPAGARINYFKGPQAGWKTDVASYSSITYPELWPGIDLVYSGAKGSLKYDFVVKPGADPSAIQLAYRGAGALGLSSAGDLQVKTPHGGFSDQKPFSYQTVNGRQVEVASSYRLGSPAAYGFQVDGYDPTLPLVIDPLMVLYAGYFGGSGFDQALGIAVDSAGAAYITGLTDAPDQAFPETVGPDVTHNGGGDAFVAKIKPDGSALDYAGYIGGSTFDQGLSIVVDSAGAAYVGGLTGSTETTFPVLVGPDITHNGGGYDAFVAKVKPDGSGLDYAGYIGGNADDRAQGIALDSTGAAYLTGHTGSTQATFPVTASAGSVYNGGASDAFVAKVKPDGTGLNYAGYIGGNDHDLSFAIAVDASGAAYITGETSSTQATFPVTVGPDLSHNGGGFDAFIVKVKPDASGLVYAGYLGGALFDIGLAIALDGTGAAYLTGETNSPQFTFPLVVGPDLTQNGGLDAFVTKVNPAGTGLVYSGYVGGSGYDDAFGIVVDAQGAAYIAGETNSTQSSFPAFGGPDSTYNGGEYDAFVTKVRPAGNGLESSGYVGGSGYDQGLALAKDSSGAVYLAGELSSTQSTFPVTGSMDTTYNGGLADGFVAKIGPTKADLSVAKSCTPNPVAPGGVLSCTITVTNAGPGTATNIRVTEDQNLAAGAVITAAPAGTGATCTVQVANPEVTCIKPSQPVGSFTISYAVQLSPDAVPGSSFSHSTTVSSDDLDLTPANNTLTQSTSIPACTITGTAVGETLNGTPTPDVICGLGGNDTLLGQGSDDILIGGPGQDNVQGADGNDTLIGGTENDQLYGGPGNDRIFGGAGNDLMLGDADNDVLVGGDGSDTASGGLGTDSCTAESLNTCP